MAPLSVAPGGRVGRPQQPGCLDGRVGHPRAGGPLPGDLGPRVDRLARGARHPLPGRRRDLGS
eukprot:15476993-Alexandrium_andersonii.AAC.1